MKKIAFLLFIIFLTSCEYVPQKTVVSRMTFPEHEYINLAESGTAIVKGRAFLKTRGGDVKVAAGNEVFLDPVTSYSMEWYEKAYVQNLPIEKADSRIWKYVRKTIADGDGRFIFKNVPAGKYFVTTSVVWQTPSDSLALQGGTITRMITVHDGGEVKVIVTREILRKREN